MYTLLISAAHIPLNRVQTTIKKALINYMIFSFKKVSTASAMTMAKPIYAIEEEEEEAEDDK